MRDYMTKERSEEATIKKAGTHTYSEALMGNHGMMSGT